MGRAENHIRNYVTYQVTLYVEDDSGRIHGEWLRFGDQYTTTLRSEVSLLDLLQSELLAAVKKRMAEQQMKGGPRRISQMGSLAKMELERLGHLLFTALLPACEDSIGYLDEWNKRLDKGGGVRLALHMKDQSLEHLPWEAMHNDEMKPLALREGFSIVRWGASDGESPTAKVRPLKVFFVDAGSADIQEFRKLSGNSFERSGLDRDQDLCAGAVAPDCVVYDDEILPALRRSNASVLHFSGHGSTTENGSLGALVLPRKPDVGGLGGGGRYVALSISAGDLLGYLPKDLQLAVLAACTVGVDTHWAGMGARLAEKVPAVVSMQAEVDDQGADDFTRQLYDSLLKGRTIDEAVADGRRANSKSGTQLNDWWIPVLHSRATEPVRFTARLGVEDADRKVGRSLAFPASAFPFSTGTVIEPAWSPTPTPPKKFSHRALVVSEDGAVCAVASPSGELMIGRRRKDGTVNWRKPWQGPAGSELIAIHGVSHRSDVSVLLAQEGEGSRVAILDAAGSVTWRARQPEVARTGAWWGTGFVWTDQGGVVHGAEEVPGLSVPSQGCQLFDSASNGEVRLAAWTDGKTLSVCRTESNRSETRRLPLREELSVLFVARPLEGPPTTVLFGQRANLDWRTWDELPSVTVRQPALGG